jgi:hypothetical protein
MPETRGLVQRIKIGYLPPCWVYIGPSPTNTELFSVGVNVNHRGPFEVALIEALSGALFSRREVIVSHEEGSYDIYMVEVVAG